MKSKSIVNFVYSYPYESGLLKLAGQELTESHSKEAQQTTAIAQRIWNKYEKEILSLFSEIYKTEITEKNIKAYITLVSPISYSDPFTISLKYHQDFDKNEKSERAFVYVTIHELAHYFAYTRYPKNYFNNLFIKIMKVNLLGIHGKNLHFLIQAVEFGIIGEVFGEEYANYSREWTIKNSGNNNYGQSALALKEHKVPLNKSCLKFISKEILYPNSIIF